MAPWHISLGKTKFLFALNKVIDFDNERTLLVDDNLAVLDSARDYGIKHLLAVNKPDSQQAKREINHYKNTEHFDILYKDWAET